MVPERTPRKLTLDGLMWRHRLRRALWWLVGLGLVSGLLLAVYLVKLPGESRQTTGVVIGLMGTPTDEGHRLYLRVALDSGEEVKARVRNETPVIHGRRAVLSETDSRFGNRRSYRFLGYEPASP